MRRAAWILAVLVAAPHAARAQGYAFYEQGACEMGRAGAGVAAPCDDGSAMFYNPAALALASGGSISVGGTGVAPRGQFTNDTTARVSTLNDRTFLVPTLYVVKPIRPGVVIGVGAFAPYGLSSDWPNSSEGRFLGYLSSIRALYFQPTVGFRATDRVSIGAGLDVTHLSVELRRRVDLAATPLPGAPPGVTFAALGVPKGTDFADVDLNGSGVRIGGHVGVIVKASDRLSVGARYLFRQHVSIDNGDLTSAQIPTGLVLPVALPGIPAGTPIDRLLAPQFAPGAPLSAQSTTTALPLPDQFVAGTALRATARLTLLADYQFTNWSLFDQVVIVNQYAPTTVLVESYRPAHGLRVAGEYGFSPAVVGRVGFDVHGAAAPDQSVTPLLPEASRFEITGGVSLRAGARTKVDLAYQYVDQSDRRGRTTDGGLAIPTPAVNNGTFAYHANLLGASLTIAF